MLWPEDMPTNSLVVLSHNDDLVPSPLVAAHLAEAHPTACVLYHPTAGHGGFLLDLPFQQQMVQVRALRCARGRCPVMAGRGMDASPSERCWAIIPLCATPHLHVQPPCRLEQQDRLSSLQIGVKIRLCQRILKHS